MGLTAGSRARKRCCGQPAAMDTERRIVKRPDEPVRQACSKCGPAQVFHWVVAYEDGTANPPLRLACDGCGAWPTGQAPEGL